jgi:Cu-Zn family superoxide dismutase
LRHAARFSGHAAATLKTRKRLRGGRAAAERRARTRAQLAQSFEALEVVWTPELAQRLEAAVPASAVAGTRYPEQQMQHLDSEPRAGMPRPRSRGFASTLRDGWCNALGVMNAGLRLTSCFTFLLWLSACGGSPAEPAASADDAMIPPAEPPPPETPPDASAAQAADKVAAPDSASNKDAPKAAKTVEVALQAKSGSKLTGKATFTETDGGVRVVIAVENVSPGEHGTHVHEKGDCSAPDAASAGGHFNPQKHDHGMPTSEKRHLGDFGNINVGKDGKGTLEVLAAGANLKPDDPNSFLNKAIIIHEKKDDGSQPTGNAGGRIGCGVIAG